MGVIDSLQSSEPIKTNLLRADRTEEEGRAVHEAIITAKTCAHDELATVGASGSEIDDHETRRILQHGFRVATEKLGGQLHNVVFEEPIAQLGFVFGRERGRGGVGGWSLDGKEGEMQTGRGTLGFKLSW